MNWAVNDATRRPLPDATGARLARPARGANSRTIRPEHRGALGIAFVEERGVLDAIDAETAQIAAQLAPGDQHSRRFEIADNHGPYGSPGVSAGLVVIS